MPAACVRYYFSHVSSVEEGGVDCVASFCVLGLPQAGFFAVGTTDCATCASGVNCDTPGVSVSSLPVTAGFWRASPASTTIVPCRIPHACAGVSGGATGRRLAGNGSTSVQCARKSDLCMLLMWTHDSRIV